MAETKIKYAADAAIAITLTGPLTAGSFRASALVENGTNLYVDALVGGMIGSAGTSWAAGDSVDFYLIAQYSDTDTDVGGGIGALLGNGDAAEVLDTDFVIENLPLLHTIVPESVAVTTDQDYHWGPVSVARVAGVMPIAWSILVHNNATGSIDSGNLNYKGITYTTA